MLLIGPKFTRAADSLDRVLLKDPQTKGEGRENGFRILVLPPLAIYFTFSEDDRLVTVHSV